MEITAGSITIQHVDTLNVYTVSGWNPDAGAAPGIDKLRAKEGPAGDSHPCSMLVPLQTRGRAKPARPRQWPIMAPMNQPPPSGPAIGRRCPSTLPLPAGQPLRTDGSAHGP